MARRDPLEIIDALYNFELDEQAWLRNVVEVLEPFEVGAGTAVYVTTFDEGGKPRLSSVENRSTIAPTEWLERMVNEAPPQAFRALHMPMPLSFSEERFPEVLNAFGIPYAPGEWRALGMALPPRAWAICGGDASATALVTFHSDGRDVRERDRPVLDALSAHLGAALRLRRLSCKHDADNDTVEAVFAPDGKVLHAKNDAKEADTQRSLIDAVLKSEQAKRRAATAEERLDIWTSLVEGRWSILESTERDGKRYMIACRNDPRTAALRALTPRERLVVSHAAYGHAYKFIAYELGIPLATVASTLTAALKKLGIPSREHLVILFARATDPFEM